MNSILSLLLLVTFMFLSGIHFYWVFGGTWGTEGVFPSKPGVENPKFPGKAATLFVAIFLMGIGYFYSVKAGIIPFLLPEIIELYGYKALAALFLFRAIGDFYYVGFFKKYTQTKFGKNDTKYFSPLCLLIGMANLFLAYMKTLNSFL